MDILEIIFSGIGGAVIASIVAYYIFLKGKNPPIGKAYEILKGLGKILQEPEGEYYITRSADDNFHVANHIYNHADGKIIATAFHEDPSIYGERDLARSFRFGGSLFTRVTSEDVCNKASEEKARESLSKILEGSNLAVIPKGEAFTRIDGIYCRLSDDTHLAFIAFRDPESPAENRGVIFRDGIAKNFFDYYEKLIKRHKK